jgi:hypothetical protein
MDRETGLIRTDQVGRLRFTKEQRRVLLEAFDGSGQTASGFAAQHGIKYTTFTGWIEQRRKAAKASSGLAAAMEPVAPLLLAEVSCEDACPPRGGCPALEVCLPDGTRLAVGGITQVPLAAALIRELSRPC